MRVDIVLGWGELMLSYVPSEPLLDFHQRKTDDIIYERLGARHSDAAAAMPSAP